MIQSVTPHVRRRSARRRSSEKSAKQMAREASPFWQTMTTWTWTFGVAGKVACIWTVADGYMVVVNGEPVNLPYSVTADIDHVTLQRLDKMLTVKTGDHHPQVTRYTVLPPWLCKGAMVHYSPPEGPGKGNCRVLDAPFLRTTALGGSHWVAVIDKHRGWVACEALSQAT